jgi:hypothetical protein
MTQPNALGFQDNISLSVYEKLLFLEFEAKNHYFDAKKTLASITPDKEDEGIAFFAQDSMDRWEYTAQTLQLMNLRIGAWHLNKTMNFCSQCERPTNIKDFLLFCEGQVKAAYASVYDAEDNGDYEIKCHNYIFTKFYEWRDFSFFAQGLLND